MQKMSKINLSRRTLALIEAYPTPKQLYNKIIDAAGYPYKTNKDFYIKRDRALVALTYLIAARISEILRLTKTQFFKTDIAYVITGIRLSKSTKAGKPRKKIFRQEAFLVLTGDRAPLTQIVLDYLAILREDKLFPFSRQRAWQIVTSITGEPIHWLRAYGENFLYDEWDHDLLAVADYVGVNPRTLSDYIHGGYKKYKPA